MRRRGLRLMCRGVFLLQVGSAVGFPAGSSKGPGVPWGERAAFAEDADAVEVRRLQRAALSAAAVGHGMNGLRARLHLSALLPQVSVSVGQGVTLTGSDKQVDGLDQLTVSDGSHISYTMSARWDLSRLIYGKEEPGIKAREQKSAQLGIALSAEVARLYYERRRLIRSKGDPDKVAELSAQLDGLTGLHGLATPAKE